MRVITPHHLKANKKKKTKPIVPFFFVFVILIVTGAFYYFLVRVNTPHAVLSERQTSNNQAYSDSDYPYFSSEEFDSLYSSMAYPNTQPITSPPQITGNETVDLRIRTIAQSRGYKLRSVPVSPIENSNEPGLKDDGLLQPRALKAWQELKSSAQVANIPIKLRSGYRSIELQRQLFLSRLSASGVTTKQLVSGQADSQIVAALRDVAIPGYSRHHTGYTIDVLCGTSVQAFETTTCYRWLSDNNYLNAKKFGWIPSEPDPANDQGPEPEAWEYSWVGQPALVKD